MHREPWQTAQRTPKPNGCGIRETQGLQLEGVAKIRPVALLGSGNLRPRPCERRGSARRASRPKSHAGRCRQRGLCYGFPTTHRDE